MTKNTKETKYTQCRLITADLNNKKSVQFAWIPQSYATVGTYISINNQNLWYISHFWETQPEYILEKRTINPKYTANVIQQVTIKSQETQTSNSKKQF